MEENDSPIKDGAGAQRVLEAVFLICAQRGHWREKESPCSRLRALGTWVGAAARNVYEAQRRICAGNLDVWMGAADWAKRCALDDCAKQEGKTRGLTPEENEALNEGIREFMGLIELDQRGAVQSLIQRGLAGERPETWAPEGTLFSSDEDRRQALAGIRVLMKTMSDHVSSMRLIPVLIDLSVNEPWLGPELERLALERTLGKESRPAKGPKRAL